MSIASAETFRSLPRLGRGAGAFAALRGAFARCRADAAPAYDFTASAHVTAVENSLADDEFDALLLAAAHPSPAALAAAA